MAGARQRWGLVLLLPAILSGAAQVTGQATGFCQSLQATRLALALGGDVDPAYQGLPVWRRYGNLDLTVQAGFLPGDSHLKVTVAPAGGGDALFQTAGAPGAHKLAVTVPLVQGDGELPVGRYRARSELVTGRTCQGPVAGTDFFVVFNPFDPRDEVFQVPPDTPDREVAANIGPQVGILAGTDEFSWDLGTYTAEVLNLALAAVDGLASALAAAEALRDLAHQQVEGYWPGLTDREGRLDPAAPPDDPLWANPWGQSVPGNLEQPDTRGQCYDYAALLTALLRTVGIPATVVTAVDPGPFPYPYNLEWEVTWAFHVWNEFFAGQTWWATDPTYPTAADYIGAFAAGAGPQPRTGGFFAPAVQGDGVRVSAEYGGFRLDVTREYRGDPAADAPAA